MSKLQDYLYQNVIQKNKNHLITIKNCLITILYIFLSTAIQYFFMFSGEIFFGGWYELLSVPICFLCYLILNIILITKKNYYGLLIINISFVLLLIYLYFIKGISPTDILSAAFWFLFQQFGIIFTSPKSLLLKTKHLLEKESV